MDACCMNCGCYNDYHCTVYGGVCVYVCVYAVEMWFKRDRYMSLASPVLPLNAKTLQAHKTKASMLGLSVVGQQGDIRESSGAF